MNNTLNILCGICNEFYKSSDIVYSTQCGHLFHKQCVFRWLNRSQSCPQCRVPCHTRRVHRVYLNFSERTDIDDELDAIIPDAPNWVFLDLPSNTPIPHPVPTNALKSGVDTDGNDLYVARTPFESDLLPANYIPSKGHATVPWNCRGHAISCDNIEYLVDDGRYGWVAAANGQVPDNAVIVGYSENGENLYTGRAIYDGALISGKIHPSHLVLYMALNGLEINTKEYEVLVRLPSPQLSNSENVTNTEESNN